MNSKLGRALFPKEGVASLAASGANGMSESSVPIAQIAPDRASRPCESILSLLKKVHFQDAPVRQSTPLPSPSTPDPHPFPELDRLHSPIPGASVVATSSLMEVDARRAHEEGAVERTKTDHSSSPHPALTATDNHSMVGAEPVYELTADDDDGDDDADVGAGSDADDAAMFTPLNSPSHFPGNTVTDAVGGTAAGGGADSLSGGVSSQSFWNSGDYDDVDCSHMADALTETDWDALYSKSLLPKTTSPISYANGSGGASGGRDEDATGDVQEGNARKRARRDVVGEGDREEEDD